MKDLTKSRSQRLCSCSSLCRRWPYALVLTSFFMLVFTAFFKWMALDWVVDHQIAQKLQLTPGTDAWNKWKDIPVPIMIRFYLFNVTNPFEFQEGGKAKLQEIGPFTYEEKRIKSISAIDNEKDTITYKQKIIYTFRPDLSNGTESDRLVIINVPFVTLSKLTVDMTNLSFAQNIADRNMRQRGERLFTFHTVKEYLFDGYNVQQYLNFLSNPALALIGKVKIPTSIETGKFGFYYLKNDTDDGEYEVRTGKKNPQDFGKIVSWNGKTKLDYYHGECNLINGTDGSIAPPFLTKKSRVRFYSTDICRSIYVVYREEVDIKGVRAYRFKMPKSKPIWDHHDFCFCPTGPNNICFKQGVLSMAPCRDDAPIAFSGAHFLDSWENYLGGVEGLAPQSEKHETFLDIEPKTGLVLRATKRVQFNVMVVPNHNMPSFANVRPTLFPFLWAEESAIATEELIDQVKQELFAPIEMANKASIGGMVSCAGLILLGFLGIIFLGSSKKKANSIHSENSDSFHGEHVFRTSSRSHTSASGISVGGVSQLSSLSGSHPPKSITSVISVMSRTTMTSVDKQTMTDSVFIIDEDMTQKMQDNDKITKI